MEPARSIATILFTDIVGSTERAAELGDRGWRGLRDQHHAIVREELARWGGREVSEAGDGFLSLFDNPAQAILSAVAIRDRVRELGLEVRCGVHMGEVEQSADGSLGGITVHIGARVAAEAGAGDVLVSSAVRDVEAGSGFGFEDRGRYELKGVPGHWRLFAVTGLPQEVTPPRQLPWITRVPRWVSAGAIALAAVLGLAGLYVVIQDRGRSSVTEPVSLEHESVAILPFRITGADTELQYLREGMVDLLASKLTGQGGLRAADTRFVLSAWKEVISGPGETLSADASLDLARSIDAGHCILGEVVGTLDRLVVSATLYDVADRSRRGVANVEGPVDSLPALVDRLTAELLAREAGEPEQRLAVLTSKSLPALRAYLDGEAAYRSGLYDEAARYFETAVQIDSTFALAGLGLMQAAGWASGVSLAQTELGERLAWAGRERLSPADRAMLAALAGPNYPAASSRLEYLAAEKRAVDEAPDRPEAWYELGDRYYHDGQMLEIKEAPELAAAAFRRSRELDPTFVPALEHGILVAALRGDTDEVREQGKRYLARHSEAPNADFYRWRIAVALADTVALSELRTRFDQMSVQSLWRIMGYAERDGDELTDVGRARSALESGTFTPGEQARSRVFLYNLLMNAGRPEEALSYLDVQGEQDHAVLRGQILAALYWGGDTTAAAEAVTRLSPLAFGPTLPEQSGQETQYRDLCVLGLWSTHRDQWGTTESAIARLNGTAQSAVSSAVGESGFCARVLETSLAVRRGSSTSASLLSELDSATKIWPVPWPLHYPLLIELVLLFEDVGDVENALKVVRRQQYSWVSLHYLSAFLQLEGRLAAEFGETDSARRAYEHYLALRTDPEPSQLTEIAEVRAALEQLREGSRTTR